MIAACVTQLLILVVLIGEYTVTANATNANRDRDHTDIASRISEFQERDEAQSRDDEQQIAQRSLSGKAWKHVRKKAQLHADMEANYGVELPAFAFDFSEYFSGAVIERVPHSKRDLYLTMFLVGHESVSVDFPFEAISTDEEVLHAWRQAVSKWNQPSHRNYHHRPGHGHGHGHHSHTGSSSSSSSSSSSAHPITGSAGSNAGARLIHPSSTPSLPTGRGGVTATATPGTTPTTGSTATTSTATSGTTPTTGTTSIGSRTASRHRSTRTRRRRRRRRLSTASHHHGPLTSGLMCGLQNNDKYPSYSYTSAAYWVNIHAAAAATTTTADLRHHPSNRTAAAGEHTTSDTDSSSSSSSSSSYFAVQKNGTTSHHRLSARSSGAGIAKSGASINGNFAVLRCRIRNGVRIYDTAVYDTQRALFVDVIQASKEPPSRSISAAAAAAGNHTAHAHTPSGSAASSADSGGGSSSASSSSSLVDAHGRHVVISFSVPWHTRGVGYPFTTASAAGSSSSSLSSFVALSSLQTLSDTNATAADSGTTAVTTTTTTTTTSSSGADVVPAEWWHFSSNQLHPWHALPDSTAATKAAAAAAASTGADTSSTKILHAPKVTSPSSNKTLTAKSAILCVTPVRPLHPTRKAVGLPALIEFIEHHLQLGFQHISFGLALDWKSVSMTKHIFVLQPYIQAGRVSLYSTTLPGYDDVQGFGGIQLNDAYARQYFLNQCLYHAKGLSDYIAVASIHDFLLPAATNSTSTSGSDRVGEFIPQLLQSFQQLQQQSLRGKSATANTHSASSSSSTSSNSYHCAFTIDRIYGIEDPPTTDANALFAGSGPGDSAWNSDYFASSKPRLLQPGAYPPVTFIPTARAKVVHVAPDGSVDVVCSGSLSYMHARSSSINSHNTTRPMGVGAAATFVYKGNFDKSPPVNPGSGGAVAVNSAAGSSSSSFISTDTTPAAAASTGTADAVELELLIQQKLRLTKLVQSQLAAHNMSTIAQLRRLSQDGKTFHQFYHTHYHLLHHPVMPSGATGATGATDATTAAAVIAITNNNNNNNNNNNKNTNDSPPQATVSQQALPNRNAIKPPFWQMCNTDHLKDVLLRVGSGSSSSSS